MNQATTLKAAPVTLLAQSFFQKRALLGDDDELRRPYYFLVAAPVSQKIITTLLKMILQLNYWSYELHFRNEKCTPLHDFFAVIKNSNLFLLVTET